ncbi:MAG TPA: hypothetical protein VI231_05965 [Candidatus Binatia bacterium]|jgi:hypothetical protein
MGGDRTQEVVGSIPISSTTPTEGEGFLPTNRRTGLDAELDALFGRPLAEFTSARNALAARLGKSGRAIDAERIKSLAKPPAPAWAVNQLYWQDPKAIDQLIGVTERIRKAQTGGIKNADVRGLLNEKKPMMAGLIERTSAILSAAGHATSPDVLRRVSATLEALAVWGNTEGAPQAGRLTADLDPPGFDALAAVMGGAKIEPARVLSFRASKAAEEPTAARARARDAVKAAEKALRDAHRKAERAQTALTKANARTATVEKQKQEIEARYAEARAEARAASNEAKNAAQAVAEAERSLARVKEALK